MLWTALGYFCCCGLEYGWRIQLTNGAVSFRFKEDVGLNISQCVRDSSSNLAFLPGSHENGSKFSCMDWYSRPDIAVILFHGSCDIQP